MMVQRKMLKIYLRIFLLVVDNEGEAIEGGTLKVALGNMTLLSKGFSH